jgi:hypothetical protein
MGIAGLTVTLYLGFTIDGRVGLQQHFLFALFATFIAILAQCMSMFYFIGTAKQVKDLMGSHPQASDFIQRTRQFKSQVFLPATLAILFTMAAWIVGGGVDTRVLPVWIHTTLALLALGTNVFAFARELRYMAKTNVLLDEVAVLLASSPQPE